MCSMLENELALWGIFLALPCTLSWTSCLLTYAQRFLNRILTMAWRNKNNLWQICMPWKKNLMLGLKSPWPRQVHTLWLCHNDKVQFMAGHLKAVASCLHDGLPWNNVGACCSLWAQYRTYCHMHMHCSVAESINTSPTLHTCCSQAFQS